MTLDLTVLFNVNANERKQYPHPHHTNVNATLYLGRKRQTLMDIDPLPWNIDLDCFA